VSKLSLVARQVVLLATVKRTAANCSRVCLQREEGETVILLGGEDGVLSPGKDLARLAALGFIEINRVNGHDAIAKLTRDGLKAL